MPTVILPDGVSMTADLLKQIIEECDPCDSCDETITCNGHNVVWPGIVKVKFTGVTHTAGDCCGWPYSAYARAIFADYGSLFGGLAACGIPCGFDDLRAPVEDSRVYTLHRCGSPTSGTCCTADYAIGTLTVDDIVAAHGLAPCSPASSTSCMQKFIFVGSIEVTCVTAFGCNIVYRISGYLSISGTLGLSATGFCATTPPSQFSVTNIDGFYVLELQGNPAAFPCDETTITHGTYGDGSAGCGHSPAFSGKNVGVTHGPAYQGHSTVELGCIFGGSGVTMAVNP